MKTGSDGIKRRRLTYVTKKIREDKSSKEEDRKGDEKTQLKLNRMRKYQMLVNKRQEQQEE
eukprot:15898291-Heterocapsa_arctica.AAC.1